MEIEESKVENKKTFKWRRTVVYTLLFLLLIPVLTFFLLQFTPIQNLIIDYATDKINASIDGKVNIDHIDLSITKGLKLERFQLTEPSGDTIMVADALNVDLASSLYSLIDNSIAIKKINLESPKIRIVKYKGQTKSNLDLILEKLINPTEQGTNEDPLQIRLDEIEVSNLDLSLVDENSSQEQNILLENGSLKINKFFKNEELDIAYVILDRPVIRLKKFGESFDMKTESEVAEEMVTIVKNDSSGLTIKLGSLEIIEGIFSLNNFKIKI